MKVLLTGGPGFIGSHVADHLLARGHEVAIVDDLSTGKRENISSRARLYEMDVRTGCTEAFEDFEPDALSHQAAQMDVRRSVREPDFDADVNVLGTIGLLQNCVRYGVEKVAFASTGGRSTGSRKSFLRPRIIRSTGFAVRGFEARRGALSTLLRRPVWHLLRHAALRQRLRAPPGPAWGGRGRGHILREPGRR